MNQLNEKGYIVNSTSPDKIQGVFTPLVAGIVDLVKQGLGEQVHSIYAYGSIPEGRAVPGKSDADFIVILHQEIAEASEILEEISANLRERFGEIVVKVDLPGTTVQEVLDPKNLEGWGAYLKILALPIYGEDIRKQFPEFQPTLGMAREFNGSLPKNIQKTIEVLQGDVPAMEKQMQIRTVAGQIIRAFFMILAPRIAFWSTVLKEQTEKVVEHFPEHREAFLYVAEARKEGKNSQEFADFLEKFTVDLLPLFEQALEK